MPKKTTLKIFQSHTVNKDESFFEFCENEKPDIFIVLAFSHFLSQKVLDLPSIGCFNIHTSILPKYRGSSPIHYALLNGDETTGVSIQKMVKKMDAGDIGYFTEQKIDQNDNYESLSIKLSEQSGYAVIEFIKQISDGSATFSPQDENEVSFAPLIKKEDALISFKESAFEILNKTKAYSVWPGTFFKINNTTYKFKNIKIKPNSNPTPGSINITSKEIFIDCKDATIQLLNIQPPGKPMMDATGFINGYKLEKNKVE